MSKAFTSEENESTGVAGRTIARAAPGEERPITEAGYRALVARRDALIAERASGSVERAKELEHPLALVAATLESVRVTPLAPADGVARFGSTVALRWDDGRLQHVILVGPDEAEGERVSIASPLGRALIGVRAGALVEIERPRGTAEAEVVEVL